MFVHSSVGKQKFVPVDLSYESGFRNISYPVINGVNVPINETLRAANLLTYARQLRKRNLRMPHDIVPALVVSRYHLVKASWPQSTILNLRLEGMYSFPACSLLSLNAD